ncbi:MAG TPA: hypothetical protein VFQ61_17950, partial [Polyangiaceae bacterium]|nr:hypothetical protein [Polyangiaceae bacterium]
MNSDDLGRLAARARERVLEQHHSFRRAERLEQLLETVRARSSVESPEDARSVVGYPNRNAAPQRWADAELGLLASEV